MRECRLKLCAAITPDPSQEELLFVRQLGLTHVYTWVSDDQTDRRSLQELRQKVENMGLVLNNVANKRLGKCDSIHLNLPDRAEWISRYTEFLRNLAGAGIYTTTFTWEPTGVWSTGRKENRYAPARYVDAEEMQGRPYTHGREYTRAEIWQNFQFFLQQVLPVAEEMGVHLSLHPNDPPVPMLGGIPNLIHNAACYKQALALADHSPYLGMEFCVGCWLEGGQDFGDVLTDIRYFARQKAINIVHFRNISSPLPRFSESFLDNGYMDMYQVLRVLVEEDYDGTVILDHTPPLAIGGLASATAYAIGYMRALLERAEAEQ